MMSSTIRDQLIGEVEGLLARNFGVSWMFGGETRVISGQMANTAVSAG